MVKPFFPEDKTPDQWTDDEIRDMIATLKEIEIARRYLVNCWQSFKYSPDDSWGYDRGNKKGGRIASHVWESVPDRIRIASPYLQRWDNHTQFIDEHLAMGWKLFDILDKWERENP